MPTEQIVEDLPTRPVPPGVEHLGSFELPPNAHETEAVEPDGATPRWARLALLVLLATTAATYLWNLAASGYGNSFYAAAVEAGSKSWKATSFCADLAGWAAAPRMNCAPRVCWVQPTA